MSCTSPNYALMLGEVDGKKKIKFLPKRVDQYSLHVLEEKYGKEQVLVLPCGHCISCRLDYARNWAVRCALEASLYKFNWFVTLTFDSVHLPDSAAGCRCEAQLFFKRLRKVYPGVRYFGCLERGEITQRFHFHFILFNLPLNDLRCVSKKKKDQYVFSSNFLSMTWRNGFVDIEEANFNTAGYVARYAMKKVGSENFEGFLMMSTKPPLGYDWLMQHKDSVLKYDKIFFNFGKFGRASLPRAFDKILEKTDPELFEVIKKVRLENANTGNYAELLARDLQYREELYGIHDDQIRVKVKRLKRSL